MAQNLKKSLQNRVFIQTLSALSPTELKAFKAFCNQPPAITGQTKRIFEYIYKVAPGYEKLTEEKLFSRFFPNNPKAKIQLNYALHDLNEMLRKWLIQKELENDEHLQNQLFIRACKKRFLHSQFFKKTHQALAVLENDFLPVPNTWHKQFETYFNLFHHSMTPKDRKAIEYLSNMETNLEMFYHGSKVRLFCQPVSRAKTINLSPEIEEKELDPTIRFARKHASTIPFFALYLQLIKHLQSTDTTTLNSFFQNFKKDRTQLDRLDQSILIFTAVYSLHDAAMRGDKAIAEIQFDLYKYAFENDLALFDNEMGSAPFNGFLVSACMLGEFKIARKMLKKYEPYFKPDIREDFTNLMWCTLLFHEKKYGKVELTLNNFKIKHPMFRIRSRHLLLKSLYERFLSDKSQKALILSELISLRKYIQKQNILPESRKNIYYDMIFVVRKLTNVAYKRSYYREKVKQELMDFLNDETKKPISRNWLLEKVREL